jgi:hypothetical protein
MKEGLLIGGGVIAAGVFVGYVAYKIVKKNPKVLKNARKKVSNVGKKASKVVVEAKQAFAEGFESAQAKTAIA